MLLLFLFRRYSVAVCSHRDEEDSFQVYGFHSKEEKVITNEEKDSGIFLISYLVLL